MCVNVCSADMDTHKGRHRSKLTGQHLRSIVRIAMAKLTLLDSDALPKDTVDQIDNVVPP